MNENSISILMVGVVVAGLLGSILRHRNSRPIKAKTNNEQQTEHAQNDPFLPLEPASPRWTILTLIGMSLLVIVWGLTIGLTVGVFSHLIYIVFVFPLIMGINSGRMVVDVVQRAKVRKTSQLLFLALLSAVVMYSSFHYTRYLGFQLQASLEIYSGLNEATDTDNFGVAKAFVDYALEEETGHKGFLGYMLYRANEGVSIGRLSRSSSFNLGPILTWLYWIVEFVIILGVTVQKGRKVIGASFCESCGNWYGGEKHLGGTSSANESFLLDLIRQKDFAGLGKLMEKNAELPSVEVYFQGCQGCGKSPSQLVVRHAFQSAKGDLRFADASQTILQPTESALLLNQFSFSGD